MLLAVVLFARHGLAGLLDAAPRADAVDERRRAPARRCSTCAASRSASAAWSRPTASTCASHAGEIHALIGPNGAGKTTLVAQLGGQLRQRPRHDRLRRRRHHAPGRRTERARRGLARSFQITRLFRSASVLDNVALAVQAVTGSSLRAWRPVAARRGAVRARARAARHARPRRQGRRMRSTSSRTASGARSRSA